MYVHALYMDYKFVWFLVKPSRIMFICIVLCHATKHETNETTAGAGRGNQCCADGWNQCKTMWARARLWAQSMQTKAMQPRQTNANQCNQCKRMQPMQTNATNANQCKPMQPQKEVPFSRHCRAINPHSTKYASGMRDRGNKHIF